MNNIHVSMGTWSPEHPCPSHSIIHSAWAYGGRSIHVQAKITLALQVHTVTRASMPCCTRWARSVSAVSWMQAKCGTTATSMISTVVSFTVPARRPTRRKKKKKKKKKKIIVLESFTHEFPCPVPKKCSRSTYVQG